MDQEHAPDETPEAKPGRPESGERLAFSYVLRIVLNIAALILFVVVVYDMFYPLGYGLLPTYLLLGVAVVHIFVKKAKPTKKN